MCASPLCLHLSETYDDVIQQSVDLKRRVNSTVLHIGFMVKEDCMNVLETWEGVKGWVMPERKQVEVIQYVATLITQHLRGCKSRYQWLLIFPHDA
ncbi:hypothetical protein ACFX11_011775 [Malus domestica]